MSIIEPNKTVKRATNITWETFLNHCTSHKKVYSIHPKRATTNEYKMSMFRLRKIFVLYTFNILIENYHY